MSGVYTGGSRTFGYSFTPDGLAIEPDEAALIHDAVKRLARHETSYRIVLDWNASGRRTAAGARWSAQTFRRMIRGEHLTGGNGYPRILTDVEAAIVRQELVDQPKLKARAPGRRFPLSSFLYCSECGEKLTTGSSGYYRCGVSHGGCGAVSIKATPFERYLAVEGFRHYVTERQRGVRAKQPERPAVDTSPGLAELHDVEERISEISDALADPASGMTVAVASAASQKLEDRRRALLEQLARSLPPVESRPTLNVGDIFTRDEVTEVLGAATDRFGGNYADDSFRQRWEERKLTEAEAAQLRDLFSWSASSSPRACGRDVASIPPESRSSGAPEARFPRNRPDDGRRERDPSGGSRSPRFFGAGGFGAFRPAYMFLDALRARGGHLTALLGTPDGSGHLHGVRGRSRRAGRLCRRSRWKPTAVMPARPGINRQAGGRTFASPSFLRGTSSR